jgi:hypothetical protein
MAGVTEDTLSSEQDTHGTAVGSDSAVGEAAYGRRRRMRREEVVAAQLHKWYPVSPNTHHNTFSPIIPTPQSLCVIHKAHTQQSTTLHCHRKHMTTTYSIYTYIVYMHI